MTISPALTFSLLLGVAYGLLAHLILGGDIRRLLAYVAASLIGFGIGQGIGSVMSIQALTIGQINMLPASAGSIIAVITLAILSRSQNMVFRQR